MAHGFNLQKPRFDCDPTETDSRATGVVQFDYEAVFDRLDGLPASRDRDLAFAVARFLRWIVEIDWRHHPKRRQELAGRRAFVLVWIFMPKALGHMSLRSLARYLQCPVQRLSDVLAQMNHELRCYGLRQRRGKRKAA